ncbi:MAG: hypothetical protein IH864_03255 [Chloroflexi bacterium]|nr:hypothetical protein [Chloroflexota bacterium]
MRRVLLLTAIVFGGVFVARRLLTAERREGLSRLPGTLMERCMELMPEDSPPKVMTSGIQRMQEQNEELLALLREQNDLLRERLPAEKAPARTRRQAKETDEPSSD